MPEVPTRTPTRAPASAGDLPRRDGHPAGLGMRPGHVEERAGGGRVDDPPGEDLALGAGDVPGARVEVAAHLRHDREGELDPDPPGGGLEQLDVEPGMRRIAGDERRIGLGHAGDDAAGARTSASEVSGGSR